MSYYHYCYSSNCNYKCSCRRTSSRCCALICRPSAVNYDALLLWSLGVSPVASAQCVVVTALQLLLLLLLWCSICSGVGVSSSLRL